MPFLTAEQVKAVRLKNSKVIPIEGLDGRSIRLLRLSSSAAFLMRELRKQIADGTKTDKDLFLALLEHGCADEEGTPLTAEDAQQLFEVLPVDEIKNLVTDISAAIPSEAPGKTPASKP